MYIPENIRDVELYTLLKSRVRRIPTIFPCVKHNHFPVQILREWKGAFVHKGKRTGRQWMTKKTFNGHHVEYINQVTNCRIKGKRSKLFLDEAHWKRWLLNGQTYRYRKVIKGEIK